ncbi:TetR/AcrR family transcriptional repressor of lmrAB and yxaGH operons [Crossiella equi]|uniref:TetR/AcrR family transcriptional repressor of lmrAB and yxaGH operons n=1 Tax=Crossiella equi TaxID=130796 RepID=A0ABS5A9W5_9PSEU|nr:TetR/AcrR family transcriptional regulator [Crossiella equi]MBP2473371.1 TetR/AcrR family transcriptional repressor of lmrAB and yxaGH operons [Crossiella equi]
MTKTEPGTRDRILAATSRLLERQGYHATGVKQIAQEAKATLGSVYHFFPGGKVELAVASVHHVNTTYAAHLQALLDSHPHPADAIEAWAQDTATYIENSNWTEGCPITATALESAGQTPELQEACRATFANWESLVRAKLESAGLPTPDATDLAATVLNTLTGAEVSTQLTRTTTPMTQAATHLRRLLATYLPD